ncbi:hypothetical protein ACPXB6_28070, partial [Klebsiella pneumoniae]
DELELDEIPAAEAEEVEAEQLPLVDEPDVEIPEPVAAEAEAEMSEADEAAPAAVDEEPAETVTVDLVDGKAAAEHDEPLAAITPLHRGP